MKTVDGSFLWNQKQTSTLPHDLLLYFQLFILMDCSLNQCRHPRSFVSFYGHNRFLKDLFWIGTVFI